MAKAAKKNDGNSINRKPNSRSNTSSKNSTDNTGSKTQMSKNQNSKNRKSRNQTGRRRDVSIRKAIAVVIIAIMLVAAIGTVVWYYTRQTSDVAAEVNSVKIMNSQLELQYSLLPQNYRDTFTKEQILEQIIDEEIVIQAAGRENIIVTDAEVNERVQKILSQNKISITDLQENLASSNVSLDEFEELVRRQILLDNYMNRTVWVQDIDDATLKQVYETTKQSYAVGEQATVRHILISMQRPDAALLAKRLYDAAKDGSDFCELVKNNTDDRGSRETCGQYTFPKNFMVPEFEKAAFTMKDGDYRMIQTQFGYHIIHKINMTPASIKPFEEVRDGIKGQIIAAERSRIYRELIMKLRSQSTIKYANGTIILPASIPSGVMGSGGTEPVNAKPDNAVPDNNTVLDDVVPNDAISGDTVAPVQETRPAPATSGSPVETKSVEPDQAAVKATDESTAETVYDIKELLSCIAPKAKLYGASWESATQDAISTFSKEGVSLDYKLCDKTPDICEGINAYPTWVISGKKYLGVMSLEQLKSAAYC